jgi:N-acetyltransferase
MRAESFRPPLELSGRYVRLVPLEESHAEALGPIWSKPEVNRYLIGLIPGPAPDDVRRLIGYLLEQQRQGSDLPFTTLRASDGAPIGMTRYLHVDRANDAVEIGGSWNDPSCWRTPGNTESKLLLLRHAFDVEGAHRVCLQTDQRNLRSQAAIARIGGKQEAVLRDDRRLADDAYRSSVFFRILRREWPDVERSLIDKLSRPWVPPGPGTDSTARGVSEGAPISAPAQLPPVGLRPPITLRGRLVELVPLEPSQIPALARAGKDPEIWRLLRIGPGRDEREMSILVDEFLAGQADGTLLPFTVRALPRGTPIGMLRFLDIERRDRKAEIGTWLDPGYWRTPVNTELKYLGLMWAFEQERLHRVQLRTDSRNARSQRAIERLGAVREGVHDEHLILRDGTHRSSLVYSILEFEWPAVKARLEEYLARPWPGAPPTPATAPAPG